MKAGIVYVTKDLDVLEACKANDAELFGICLEGCNREIDCLKYFENGFVVLLIYDLVGLLLVFMGFFGLITVSFLAFSPYSSFIS